jgi:thiol-disulfide isomerase/thioredoxin
MNARTWILLFCVPFLFGCKDREEAAQNTSGRLGAPAAALTSLSWVKGGPVQITPGKVYVVEFWATWCPPCRVTIPHLTSLQQKYKDKNVTIVGISQEPLNVVKPYVEQRGAEMDYAVAVDPQEVVTAAYMDAFRRNTIPSAFVVDAQGKIVWVGHPMDDLDATLEKLVSGMPGTPGG